MIKTLNLLDELSQDYYEKLKTYLGFKEQNHLCDKIDSLFKDIKNHIKLSNETIQKYAMLETLMSSFKQLLFIYNEYQVDTYEKFSSLESKVIKQIKKDLLMINKLYDESLDLITKDFQDSIETLKEDALKLVKENKLNKLIDFSASYNVFSSIHKYIRPHLTRSQKEDFNIALEQIKDKLLLGSNESFMRPNLITSLYNLSSFEVDIGDFLEIKPFKLNTTYFKNAAKLLDINIIVINLSKKVKFKYLLPKESIVFLTPDNIKNNRCIEELTDKTIFDADEVTYYPYPLDESKKTIVFKTLGDVNYVMSNFYKKPEHLDQALYFINQKSRIHSYNKIFEDIFFQKDSFYHYYKPHNQDLYYDIQVNVFKHKILAEIENKKPKKPNQLIMKMIADQIKALCGAEIYEYIYEFENLDTNILLQLQQKKDIKSILDDLIKPDKNIYKSAIDIITSSY